MPMLHAQRTLQDDREFIEFRGLTWFQPATGAAHPRDARHLGLELTRPINSSILFGLLPADWLRVA
jgi:hypothetical protein